MKKTNLLLLSSFIVTITLLSSFVVVAEKSHQQKYEDALGPQMQVKCHVEYRGGGDDIRFVVGDFNNPMQAKKMLQGKKVIKHNGKSSKTIFKVKQCVQQKEQFAKEKAKQLDKITAR